MRMSVLPSRRRGARVMWDVATGRTKAYGFASFRTREDAQAAIDAMQGQAVGSRQIRCGWAQHKQVSHLARVSPWVENGLSGIPTEALKVAGRPAPQAGLLWGHRRQCWKLRPASKKELAGTPDNGSHTCVRGHV